ncbi:hypothetical protein EYF80_038326 [Liparis tanakae]|uniref:Uncharacterized protein n=1 Tax=Liparis tanakae TaxID=230148 RepID=A0A4Z2GD22_9TELE|nr:hypothetical protein EYF80_038326 [Liparis tanakae]
MPPASISGGSGVRVGATDPKYASDRRRSRCQKPESDLEARGPKQPGITREKISGAEREISTLLSHRLNRRRIQWPRAARVSFWHTAQSWIPSWLFASGGRDKEAGPLSSRPPRFPVPEVSPRAEARPGWRSYCLHT